VVHVHRRRCASCALCPARSFGSMARSPSLRSEHGRGRFSGFPRLDDCKKDASGSLAHRWKSVLQTCRGSIAVLWSGLDLRAAPPQRGALQDGRARAPRNGLWDLGSVSSRPISRRRGCMNCPSSRMRAWGSNMKRCSELAPPMPRGSRDNLPGAFTSSARTQKFEFECRILHPEAERGSLWAILRGLIVYQRCWRSLPHRRHPARPHRPMEAQARLVGRREPGPGPSSRRL